MDLNILGKTVDLRTNTPIIYAQMKVSDYLMLIGDEFENFRFQRKKINYKPYVRMKEDIRKGALLPPITLAVKPNSTNSVKKVIDDNESLKQILLKQAGDLNILDGLQRTYILKELKNEGFEFFPEQQILLEFWIEEEIKHLIYRLIVLNAGQKRMSMRHQIEILFLTIRESLENQIPDIVIHSQKDSTRRNRPKKYAFDNIVMAYQSFLLKNTEVKRSNLVAQEMMESDALDSNAEDLGEEFELFKKYLVLYSQLDELTYEHYSKYSLDFRILDNEFSNMDAEDKLDIPNVKNWFSDENVMTAFFAIVSKRSKDPNKEMQVYNALQALRKSIEDATPFSDPLGFRTLFALQNGFNPKKVSVDYATRKLLYSGFDEYFRERGEVDLADCWTEGAY